MEYNAQHNLEIKVGKCDLINFIFFAKWSLVTVIRMMHKHLIYFALNDMFKGRAHSEPDHRVRKWIERSYFHGE